MFIYVELRLTIQIWEPVVTNYTAQACYHDVSLRLSGKGKHFHDEISCHTNYNAITKKHHIWDVKFYKIRGWPSRKWPNVSTDNKHPKTRKGIDKPPILGVKTLKNANPYVHRK